MTGQYRLTPEGRRRLDAVRNGERNLAHIRAVGLQKKTPEALAKRAASRKLKQAEISAKVAAANTGKTVSAETRARIAAAMRGRPSYERTPAIRAKASATKRARLAVKRIKPKRLIGLCVYCGAQANTMDHIIPKVRGGSDDPGNLVPACLPCNASKRELTPVEWRGGHPHVPQNPAGGRR